MNEARNDVLDELMREREEHEEHLERLADERKDEAAIQAMNRARQRGEIEKLIVRLTKKADQQKYVVPVYPAKLLQEDLMEAVGWLEILLERIPK